MSSVFKDSDLDRMVLDVKRNIVAGRLDGVTNQLYNLLLDNEGVKLNTAITDEQRDQALAQQDKMIETTRAALVFYQGELDAIDAAAKG